MQGVAHPRHMWRQRTVERTPVLLGVGASAPIEVLTHREKLVAHWDRRKDYVVSILKTIQDSSLIVPWRKLGNDYMQFRSRLDTKRLSQADLYEVSQAADGRIVRYRGRHNLVGETQSAARQGAEPRRTIEKGIAVIRAQLGEKCAEYLGALFDGIGAVQIAMLDKLILVEPEPRYGG